MPFAIPKNWKWIRLKEIATSNIGLTYRPIDISEKGIPVLRSSNIKNGNIDLNDLVRVSCDIPDKCVIHAGDILLCVRNGSKALVGKCALMPVTQEDKFCFGAFMAVVRSRFNQYLKFFFESAYFRMLMLSANNNTAINQIAQKKLLDVYIPLPTLEEQRRIVTKVNQLFEQIDCAEKAYNELSGPLSERFRQLCLEKAIKGKLVPQLESEPAVEQIGEAPEDVPFAIPEKWKWVRLGMFVQVISGTSYRPQDTTGTEDGIRILRGGNVGQQYKLLTFDNDVFVSKDLYNEDKQIRKGDIVIVASTGSKEAIGRPAFARVTINGQIGAFLRIIRCTNQDFVPFIQIVFMSDFYRGRIRNLAKGTNINNIKKSYIEDLFVPCPPIEEQHRIVAKLNKLLDVATKIENTISN